MNKSRIGSSSRPRTLQLLCLVIGLLLAGRVLALAETVDTQGKVFHDANANGRLDEDEKGIPEVLVSDGVQVVQTDKEGRFAIKGSDPSKSHFVFVVTPSGYKSTATFYHPISSNAVFLKVQFGLATDPASLVRDFSFIQVSDTHIVNDWTIKELVKDLAEMKPLKPAFVINTGDVMDTKEIGPWESYARAGEQSKVRVINVRGNHDYPSCFETTFGPTYYAFDYGGRHFVVLDCAGDWSVKCPAHKQQLDWLTKDLALQPKGKDVLLFQHAPPSQGLLDILPPHSVRAIFSGHWHASKVHSYKGVLCVNTPPLVFGGIDVSPRGFRRMTFQGEKLLLEDHYSRCKRYCAMVTPAKEVIVPEGAAIPVLAEVYDVSAKARTVEYRLDDASWEKMCQVSKSTWRAEIMPAKAGSHRIAVKAKFDSGDVAETNGIFTVIRDFAPVPQPDSDWPMFRGDAARTGVAPTVIKPPLRLAWSQSLGGTIHISSPIVYQSMVYVGVSDEENRGLAGVCALDAVTGVVKWRHTTSCSIKHTVAADNGMIYALTVDGTLLALDATSGQEKWMYSFGNGLAYSMYAAPVVFEGVVYAASSGFSAIAAVDGLTGKELWRVGGLAPYNCLSTLSSPSVTKDLLFVGFNSFNEKGSGLFALNRQDGQVQWKYTNTPCAAGYVSPSVYEGRVYYAGCGGQDPEKNTQYQVHAIDVQSGKQVQSYRYTGRVQRRVLSATEIEPSTVAVGAYDGCLHAFDRETGKEIWKYRTGQPALAVNIYWRGYAAFLISAPAVAGTTIYLVGADGKLTMLDARQGKPLWTYDLGFPVTSSPALSGNTLYIATYSGNVYAFVGEAEAVDK